MTTGFDATDIGQQELIGALHQGDLTARPQILDKETNPSLYNLIEEFHRITGVAGLLNTSFNLHGFPIVCNADDALYVFLESDLDYLLLNDVLIVKENCLVKQQRPE